MSLSFQGSWTLTVKSREAAFAQRFRIVGASVGNGNHPGDLGSAPVQVDGASWQLVIEAQNGRVWQPSLMRFKTPVASGSTVRVDVESDDGGAGGDQDFNDLVLTCTMAASATDFVLHGHASAYSGRCLFNPCWRTHLVIDSPWQLAQALKNAAIRDAIAQLRPELLRPQPPDPGPLRTFTPVMLPTPRSPALAAPLFQLATGALKAAPMTAAAGAVVHTAAASLSSAAPVGAAAATRLDPLTVIRLGRLLDGFTKVPLRCTTTPLARYGLRFLEYDRSADELGGGAYTGSGDRETLGAAVTDGFGNYVFRFSRTLGQVVDEALGDVAPGEVAADQARPDVIAQLRGAGSAVAAETGCHFNVPNLHRLDLCIPASQLVLPIGCGDGSRLLTTIGKVSLTSALNSLDAQGRLNAASGAANALTIACAAWYGDLDLWGCIGKANAVWYSVRTRPLGSGPAGWHPHGDDETRERGDGTQERIGPAYLPPVVPSDASPAGLQAMPIYRNVQRDSAFVQPGAMLFATLHTGAFVPGPYELRIDTYDKDGANLGAESVTLFIDNRPATATIDAITLAGAPVSIDGNGCTLQTLTPAQLSAPLTVRFKVEQAGGLMQQYGVGVAKCNSGGFATTWDGLSGAPSFSWVRDPAHSCSDPANLAFGTADDPADDGSGYVTTTLLPDSPWLAPGEPFTILRVAIGYHWRATNGYTAVSPTSTGQLVWGVQA